MRSILSLCAILLLTSPSFAGSCPIKLVKIDEALSAGTVLNAKEVKALRDKGEALHKSGDHSGSVAMLMKAMKLAGIKG